MKLKLIVLKQISIIIVLLSLITFFTTCKTNKIPNSLAVIDLQYNTIFEGFNSWNEDADFICYTIIEKEDSLVVISNLLNLPFEALYLFKNDSCYYQKINVYCSTCSDKIIERIVSDKRYKFNAIDPVNYVSVKDAKIIMRLKERLNEKGNCNEITIVKID